MTIPRDLGPGPEGHPVLPVLPNFRRSSATVERMIENLGPPAAPSPAGHAAVRPVESLRRPRVLLPADALRDTLMRTLVAAAGGVGALMMAVALALLALTVDAGRAPSVGLLLVMLPLGVTTALTLLLSVRFAIVALATARARVEISEHGLRVVGALSSRDVAWHEISAVRTQVVHPVHWLTATLRLTDGTQVVMPVFDRPVWTYGRRSGHDLRTLRRELRRQQRPRP